MKQAKSYIYCIVKHCIKIYSISLYVLMASRENIKMTVALAVLPLEAGEVLNAALCLGSTDCVQLMCFKRINFSFSHRLNECREGNSLLAFHLLIQFQLSFEICQIF